jgi:hypothetical protein
MIEAGAATWAPTAVGVGLALLVPLLLGWSRTAWRRPGGADEPDSDPGSGDGGLGVPRQPRRPPPVGPDPWAAFERQFAAYVAARDDAARNRERLTNGGGRPAKRA